MRYTGILLTYENNLTTSDKAVWAKLFACLLANLKTNHLLCQPDVLSRPAEEFGNDKTLEHLWATKAMEHSDIYFNVLCSVDTRWLQLTPHDDLIYTHFRQDFPDLDVSFIKENEIKNNTNKAKWRAFCEKFKNIIEDYSFGTLLRADTNGDYSEQNTILVPRVQFYAIEVARNRENLNNEVKKRYKSIHKLDES